MKVRKIPIPVPVAKGLNGVAALRREGESVAQVPPEEPCLTSDRFGHEVILSAKSARTKKPVVR